MNEDIVFNKTKIVATVGPASNTKEMLTALVKSGANVFRLNFSHGTHEDHKKVIELVREINEELGTHVSLLQDLQGPKIRVNEVEKGAKIERGQKLVISTDKIVGDSNRVSTSYEMLPNDVKPNDMILIDDGKLELKVEKVEGNDVITEVIYGGSLKSRKGINLPFSKISAPSLTEKDRIDLAFGLENNVDWIALSFVRSAEDIHDLRERIKKAGKDIRIIAKIEKPEAMENIDAIIDATDAIMVARGDLGVEIVMEDVPMAQKMIVEKCKRLAKPVIIATQMMESMIESPRPTRAETNDVANAVLDGADALMLSAETAAGAYPVEVIQSMVRTITSVEKGESVYFNHYMPEPKEKLYHNNALLLAACRLAKASSANAIMGLTMSGYTAFKISSHRPKANVFIFTGNKKLLPVLSLVWGVRGYYYDNEVSTDDTISDIEKILKDAGHVKPGDVFIGTASMPMKERGRANMLKIHEVS